MRADLRAGWHVLRTALASPVGHGYFASLQDQHLLPLPLKAPHLQYHSPGFSFGAVMVHSLGWCGPTIIFTPLRKVNPGRPGLRLESGRAFARWGSSPRLSANTHRAATCGCAGRGGAGRGIAGHGQAMQGKARMGAAWPGMATRSAATRSEAFGAVAERLIALASKASRHESVSGVRILPAPPSSIGSRMYWTIRGRV